MVTGALPVPGIGFGAAGGAEHAGAAPGRDLCRGLPHLAVDAHDENHLAGMREPHAAEALGGSGEWDANPGRFLHSDAGRFGQQGGGLYQQVRGMGAVLPDAEVAGGAEHDLPDKLRRTREHRASKVAARRAGEDGVRHHPKRRLHIGRVDRGGGRSAPAPMPDAGSANATGSTVGASASRLAALAVRRTALIASGRHPRRWWCRWRSAGGWRRRARRRQRPRRWQPRRSGVVAAVFALNSSPRPGTNPVATTPGETPMTRISGASARPSDFTITSVPAFTAQYAMLEPLPFSAAMEEMNTISPSPLAFSMGAKARTVANWPRQLTAEHLVDQRVVQRVEVGVGYRLGEPSRVHQHIQPAVSLGNRCL